MLVAARLRRLEPFAAATWDLRASELLKATVGRPKTKLARLAVDRSRSAVLDLRCPSGLPHEGFSEGDHETSWGAKPHRPP